MAEAVTTIVRDFSDLDLNFTIHPVKKDINKNLGALAVINSIKKYLNEDSVLIKSYGDFSVHKKI